MRKNTVEPGRPQMKIWRMLRIASWVPKATNTHSEYAILTAVPQQQRLHDRPLMLRYTYIAYLVHSFFRENRGRPFQKSTVNDVFLSALRPCCHQHEVVIMLN
jgi:hypothetical protein